MRNLSQYRLTDFSEILKLRDAIGMERFDAYASYVYTFLAKFNDGDSFDISDNIKATNIPVFVKLTCQYMIDTKADCNIIFSDDFGVIKGVTSYNQCIGEIIKSGERFIKWKRIKNIPSSP